MPETVGDYGDRTIIFGTSTRVRVVRLDDGCMVFEHFVGLDAMGDDSWRPLDLERGRPLVERACREHAAKISADHRCDPVVADLVALIDLLCPRPE